MNHLIYMRHPFLFLCGGGRVDGERLASGADQPTVLELGLVLQGFQLDLKIHLKQTVCNLI